MLIDMSPENAEAELLHLVRLKDAKSFTLNVICLDGRWTIVSDDLDHSGLRAIGEGAWFKSGSQVKLGWRC